MNAPRLRRRRTRGFSLVEIVLALGVFAFAMVAILALFPAALNTAQRSRAETIGTQIARSIFSTMRGNLLIRYGTNAQFAGGYQTDGPNFTTGKDTLNYVDLAAAAPQERFLLYSADGAVVGSVANPGANGAGATGAYLVSITTQAEPGTVNLARVTVTVEYPAAAKKVNRERLVFVSMIAK